MTFHKKAIVAIADGLGDRPIAEFNGLTPLQKANTPNLDKIASEGITGMMDLIAPSIAVGTDLGHLILFGGDKKDYMGRGPIEAAGINMDIQPDDVVLRCNFATINEDGVILDRRAGRINQDTHELAQAINGMQLGHGVIAYFQPATEHRAVLILRGPNLSTKITDSDPNILVGKQTYLTVKPSQNCSKAQHTSDLFNLFLQKSHALLNAHPINEQRIEDGLLPANFILTRGAGQYKKINSTINTYGIKACCIAGETTVLGVAKLLGITPLTDKSFSANLDSNFDLKANMVLKAIDNYDLVFVHLKATDLAGHDNLPQQKVKAIEEYDQVVGKILQHLPSSTYVALASDHSTPCAMKEHSGEPVPVAICGPGLRIDPVKTYDEINCCYGGLMRLSGSDFINTIFDYMGYSQKQGS